MHVTVEEKLRAHFVPEVGDELPRSYRRASTVRQQVLTTRSRRALVDAGQASVDGLVREHDIRVARGGRFLEFLHWSYFARPVVAPRD